MLQLVHGGREPGLRTTGTLPALVALRDCGVIDTGRFALLERSYRLLRSIEGRLRLLAAAARHDFPESDSERRTLALLLGYPDAPSLAADVHETTARVREGFTAIFDDTIRALS
jgi:glutamate-ammonia-ligase adenylyltransferase